MTPRPLSFWITAYLGVAWLGAFALLGWGMWESYRQIIVRGAQDKAQSIATQLAVVSLDAMLLRDYGTLERNVADIAASGEVAHVALWRADGQQLGNAGRHLPGVTEARAMIRNAGETLGWVSVQHDPEPARRALWRVAGYSGLGLATLALLSFLILRHWLKARLVEPVMTLIARTHPVPGASTPAPPHHAPAEVHALARALDDLNARIATHVLALEEAAQAQNDALRRLCAEQRLSTIGQMAGELAHELNTPLANILGYAQLARARTETAREPLDTVIEQARRAARIVGDMLGAVRARAPSDEPLDLDATARAFARLAEPLARRQGARLEVTGSATNIVRGDPGRTEQILFNLVSNALGAGARHVVIEVDNRVLRVIDDGPGVPETVRGRLFEPFVTSKPAGQGTGLGLAISRRLAEEMNGGLEMTTSVPGHTVFEFSLPAAS
jgi:signal transduction histidine kinase